MRRFVKSLGLLTLTLLLAAPLHAHPLSAAPSWEAFLARAWALLSAPWTEKEDSLPDGELRGNLDPNGLRGGFDPDGLRGGQDPNGEPTSELRGGSDPNGEPTSELRGGQDPDGSS